MTAFSLSASLDPATQQRPISTATSLDWQRIWVAMAAHHWKSLALVPAEGDIAIERVAEALCETARHHGVRTVRHASGVATALGEVQVLTDEVSACVDRGESILLSVDTVDSPATHPLIRVTDRAILVVRLGQSRLSAVRAAVAAIGRNRILGTIVLR